MVLSWLLLLMTALPSGTPGIKDCIYCELTDSAKCRGTIMRCGDDEDCFTGKGVAPGVGPITNKGCIPSTSCGREEPVGYMGLTYSLTTTCCSGHMCNKGPRVAGATTSLALALPLLWHWL